jgi:hypothetical protein
VLLGTIVRDTVQIVSSISNSGWNVDILGDIAIYDQAVAEGIYTTRSVILVIRAPRCVTSRQSTKSCSGTARFRSRGWLFGIKDYKDILADRP